MIVVEPVGYFCIPGSCSTMSCVVFPVMTHSLTGLTRKENGMFDAAAKYQDRHFTFTWPRFVVVVQ